MHRNQRRYNGYNGAYCIIMHAMYARMLWLINVFRPRGKIRVGRSEHAISKRCHTIRMFATWLVWTSISSYYRGNLTSSNTIFQLGFFFIIYYMFAVLI